mgnify:CR=1 FL=1
MTAEHSPASLHFFAVYSGQPKSRGHLYNFRSPRLMVAYSKSREARLDGRSQREALTRRLCHGW